MSVIGLDIGTTGAKSTLFDDENAKVLAHAYREYNLICPEEGYLEIDPQVLIDSALETIAEVSAAAEADRIRAICLTSYGESFILRDAQGKILANTMIYMDQRGTAQVPEFTSMIDPIEIFSATGCPLEAMYGVYKLRWLWENRPEILEKTVSISFIADAVAMALGADHCCDYSLAARSGVFNVRDKTWWQPAVDFAGIKASALPAPVPGGSCVGTVSAEAAEKLSLNTDVRIIIAGQDQITAAIGSGAFEDGDIANGMGTVDCFVPIFDGSFINAEKMMAYNFPVVPFLDGDDKYVTYPFNMSGGAAIKWFRDTIAKDLQSEKDVYALLNAEAPDRPTRLQLIPYFGGGGSPDMDGITPAAMLGMRIATTRGELFRGFLEGETYEMKRNLECIEELGIRPTRIMTVGGGAKSPLWMQIRADIFEHDVCLPENNEAGTLAGAILCYCDLGVYKNIREAQEHLISFKKTYTPNPEASAVYRRNYARYKKLLRAIQEVYQG